MGTVSKLMDGRQAGGPIHTKERNMAKTVSEVFVETLIEAGVRRVYGVAGDSLNGLTDAIRKSNQIDWLHVRHEETAAFAAGADAQVTGKLAVCAGSCGPGNLHLINGLYDCHRTRVPVVAIAAQIPSSEIGSSYFQETHPEQLFKECSHYCKLVSQPEQMSRVLGIAMRTAITKQGVAVVIIPGDIALRDCNSPSLSLGLDHLTSTTLPSSQTLEMVAALCGAQFFPLHDRKKPPNATFNVYQSADDQWFLIVVQPKDWPALANAIGRPELLTDPRFADTAKQAANSTQLTAILDEVFRSQSLPHWREALDHAHITYGVVHQPQDVINDPQLPANDIIVPLEGAGERLKLTVSSPIKVHGVSKVTAQRAPELGEHNEEVLKELGFTSAEIDGLLASAVIPRVPNLEPAPAGGGE
jgi:hypothetical protein